MLNWVGAAGCCVNEGKLLMVRDKDSEMWSVPSGGQESGESLQDCCVREVWEETGYKVEVVRHIFTKTGTWGEYSAEVHYFSVELLGGFKQIQDPDELIGDINWTSRAEIDQITLKYPEDQTLLIHLLDSDNHLLEEM